MTKSVFGLDENIAAALSNATFGIFGAVALIQERENKFVRFHAMQSIIVFFGLAVVSGVIGLVGGILGSIPILGWLLGLPFGLIDFVLGLVTALAWAYLTFMAYSGKMPKVPVVGDVVLRQLEK
ncbi:MAG: hypothetical protein FWE68_00925 [Defluviitaleaceae bacterium]|nr:hypothetical protein [Defluviitaleaceae bacterium]